MSEEKPEADRVIHVATDPSFVIEAPTNNPGGIEREVFGKWTVILRNLTGALAVVTTCVAAIMNAWSVNHSVTTGGGWPDTWNLFIMNVGPVIVAWTWINANKTLSTLLEATSLSTKIRGRVAEIVAPKGYDLQPSNRDGYNVSQAPANFQRPTDPPPGPPQAPYVAPATDYGSSDFPPPTPPDGPARQ